MTVIVITGGAGFIGSNIVNGLLARNRGAIAVCDELGKGHKWQNLWQADFDYFVHPLEFQEFLDDHRHDIDAIVHMGAVTSTMETDADLTITSNFKLTMSLFDWCAIHKKRLIYASSAATYGDGHQGFQDDNSLRKLQQLKPLNVYGWSKHKVDMAIARRQLHNHPQPQQCVGLKFFNVYGPFEDHKDQQKSVVNHIYHQIVDGHSARLFKSYLNDYAHGDQKRDFIWVGDCVDVVLWFLDHPHNSGLYNVGTGNARTFNDLARATFTALDRSINIEYVDMPTSIQANYQYFTQASLDKLRTVGYDRAFTPLEEGVRQYVQNYRHQQP